MLKIYAYKNCSTCKKAIQYLKAQDISFTEFAIRETPPSIEELRFVLNRGGYELKKLFNVSGQDYRALNMKEKLPGLSEEEALKLLSENGNLVKRPFVITENTGLVGFKEEDWLKVIS